MDAVYENSAIENIYSAIELGNISRDEDVYDQLDTTATSAVQQAINGNTKRPWRIAGVIGIVLICVAVASSITGTVVYMTIKASYEDLYISSVTDKCQPTPCIHGQCYRGGKDYICICEAGFQGIHCEFDINECDSSPCQNGATSTDGQNTYTCTCAPGWIGNTCDTDSVQDCKDVLDKGLGRVNGLYTIYIDDNGHWKPVEVFCDMMEDGGGWTVFQYRYNGSVDFYRNFSEYEAGFGKYPGEFWLGLKWLHLISTQKQYQLRVDVTSATGQAGYATYTNFSVGAPDNYTLHVTGFIPGSIKVDPFTHHNGYSFTTYDRDQDVHSSLNCASSFKGAWWYKKCYYSNLNGIYLNPGLEDNESMNLRYWPSVYESLKTSKLSIKSL